MSEFFKEIGKIAYEGKESTNPLSFKYYDPEEVVAGKTMREQLKFALSWWHTMSGDGTDMFGVGTADKATIYDLEKYVTEKGEVVSTLGSGRQEYLESILNNILFSI